jgi:UDP-GlcNAc:undecaprenyl-phosphate GlcNAc-1-phosphate transferase
VASTLIFVAGLINDVRSPSFTRELVFQFAAVALLLRAGIAITFPTESWWSSAGTWTLTFFWIWSISRAFRFLNGLDGLAAGSAAINGLFLGVYAFVSKQPQLALLSLALMAITLGFLPYTYKPMRRPARADVLLGDAGSLYLGFVLATLAVTGTRAGTSLKDLMVPLLILALPFSFAIYASILCLKYGRFSVKNKTRRSRQNVNVQLLSLGIRRTEAVAVLYLVNLCLGISAFLLEGSTLTDAFLIFGQLMILFGIIGYAISVMKSRRSKPPGPEQARRSVKA